MAQANHPIQHSEVLSSKLGKQHRKKILASISVIGTIVSTVYATLLWKEYEMLLSSITDLLYAILYGATFYWIRKDKLTIASYWIVLIASLQVTIGTIFFVGAETGFQLYFMTLPVVIHFLLNDETTLRKVALMLYGCLCFIAGHTLRHETYMAPIPNDIAQGIFIGNALIIFVIVVSAVKFFSDEVLNAYQEQNKLVLNDKLTGIANLRFVEQYAPKLLSQADRYGHPLSLIYFDLDRFTHINDQYGQGTGDVCLQLVVREIQSDLREADILARIGADEFIVILPETAVEEVKNLSERLKSKVDSLTVPEQEDLKLSANFGYSFCDSSSMKTIESLISEAKR